MKDAIEFQLRRLEVLPTDLSVPGILLEANEDLSKEEVKELARSVAANFI